MWKLLQETLVDPKYDKLNEDFYLLSYPSGRINMLNV